MVPGTPDVPTRTSTFSSSTSLRALRVAADGSERRPADQLDVHVADLAGVGVRGEHALLIGNADRSARSAQRGDKADGEIGAKARADGEHQRSDAHAQTRLHDDLPTLDPIWPARRSECLSLKHGPGWQGARIPRSCKQLCTLPRCRQKRYI
jgi:hypothetical protein